MLKYRIAASVARVTKGIAYRLTDGRVHRGPFRSTRYVRDSVGSAFSSKLFGTYELELWPIVSLWPGLGIEHAIDIGAAEGFYAIGIARQLGCPVTTFEMDPVGRSLLAEMPTKGPAGRAGGAPGPPDAACL